MAWTTRGVRPGHPEYPSVGQRIAEEGGGAARVLISTVAALCALALIAFGLVVLTQPRVLVGDPLPVVAGGFSFTKPDPPRLLLARSGAKATAIDLVSTPAPIVVAPPGDQTVQALAGPLSTAVARAGDAGTSGVQVIDADGRIVFDLNGADPLLPASAAKLVTAAAALTAFGADHSYTTTATSTGQLGPDGALQGDLLLLGGGDPTLVSDDWVSVGVDPDRPQTLLSAIADQIVAGGVTSITGGVVGDAGNLEGAPLADGWPQRYLDDRDATPITGLTVDEGLQIAAGGAGPESGRAAADPVAQTALKLHEALIARGVTISQPPRAAAVGESDPLLRRNIATGVLPTLGSTTSPPLGVLLASMVQRSDNHLADTFFRQVGVLSEGQGTWADAEVQTQRVLQDLQLDFLTSELADGSGLSRSDRLPAGLLTALNYRMTNSAVGVTWQDLMAVSGVSGTLRRRLQGTIAELRLRGKTGSLADVRALSGAVVGPDGRPMFFTVISNGLEGPQVTAARLLQDLVVLAISAHLYGCSELAAPAPEATTTPEPDTEAQPLPSHTCPG